MTFMERINQAADETEAENARILAVHEAAQAIINHAVVTDDPLESEQHVTIPLKWLKKLEEAINADGK